MSARPARPDRDVRRAWWSFGLFGPSLVAAFVTGEGLLAVLGHDADPTVPAGVALVAGLPALVVFALPVLVVGHFGRRAVRYGHPEGRTPAVVALVVAGAFAGTNLLQLAVALLF